MATTKKLRLPYRAKKVRGPLKIHGGKYYLARRLISLAPRDITAYYEPFMGGGSVNFNLDDFSGPRYLSDTDHHKINLMRAIRDRHVELLDRLKLVQYSAGYFEGAKSRIATFWDHVEESAVSNDHSYCNIGMAADFLISNRMSRGGLGEDFAWSDRLRGGRPGDLNAWHTMLAEIPNLHDLLHGTYLHVQSFTKIDKGKPLHPFAWVYFDPTYFPSTRKAKKAYGKHEMTPDQHKQLADIALALPCRVMVSGYDCPEYRGWYDANGWRRVEFDIANHSSQAKTKERRTEIVWMNYAA